MLGRRTGYLIGLGLSLSCAPAEAADTLPPLKDGEAPTTVEGTWAGFDPRKEPLDVEVLKEWEEDGAVVKVIRFRVGIFKGKKAMMAAVHGYPKGAKAIPGLVQIHGGGQSAQSSFVVEDAKNGYATISIAWAGRINATEYKVTNKEKEAFWTGDTEHPDYRVTTDWGAVDAYHHHCRFKGNNFVQNPPGESTVDPVKSPRNSGWFLCTLGARRAITFLEQQPQVDKDRIGVYGMSMGGKLTVLTAGADSRIKAAAPACGGLSDLSTKGRTLAAVADDEYLKRITCPTIIMSPSNDFHSQVQDIPAAVKALKSKEWRVVSSPNRNHGDRSEYSVGTVLWFDQFLKGSFAMAKTPTTELTLRTTDGSPRVTVTPDASQKIVSVNVYYTQGGERKPADRYWRLGKPVGGEGTLTFELPLLNTDSPLWAYADVQNALGRTVQGVGYSGEKVETDTYRLASVVEMVGAEALKAAGAVATIDESVLKEDFDTYKPGSDPHTAFPAFTFRDAISCVRDPEGRPGMSIRMLDAPDLEYDWLPLITLNTPIAPFIGTGKWTFSAEIMLDAKEPVPLTVEFRARDHKKKFTPIIVDSAGTISARGKTTAQLCTVQPGTWWTFSVTYDLNDSEAFQVAIQDAAGAKLAEKSIEIQGDVGAVNWVGFIAHGKEAGSLYVDNVSLAALPTPPDVWEDYNPDAGDLKEEIISEKTEDGVYYRDAYISAYVNGEEVRVYCKYAVKAGATSAPGLMNVHGWMGGPAIDPAYVKDGWAVMAHDYSGITNRPHYTKYPEALAHGHMEARKMGHALIYDRMPDGSQLTDPKATSHYLWNAVQRRALSYLLAQKEVAPDRIGAKGYSYGGTIMWNLAMDSRVKTVVAYFGIGWINYYRNRAVWRYDNPPNRPARTAGEELYLAAVAPQAHAPHITAASLWLNGSNDHHGGHERGCETFRTFKPGVPWDFAVQARGHHNTEKLGDDCKLWLEKHVLGKKHFWPARPESGIRLDDDGVPEFRLTPANPERIKEIQVYQCLKTANNIARHWRDVEAVRGGDTWTAELPVLNVDDYVFAYANIRYDNNCVVSSDFEAVIPSELGNAVATDRKTDLISEGTEQWSHVAPAEGVGGVKGFRPLNNRWGTSTKQFGDPKWQAPKGAALSFRFYCTQPQDLVIEGNGQFVADFDVTASDDWQSMTMPADQLKHKAHGAVLGSWSDITSLTIKPKQGADITKVVFAEFKWVVPPPETPKPDEQGKIYLTRDMASKVDSFWRVLEDKSVEGKQKISVGGTTYERGLGVHAPSEIVFPLDGKYKAFHVVPGPDDAHHGTLGMKVLVDDKEVFATDKVRSIGYQAKPLRIPVVGAVTLTLRVGDGGDGKGGDHASWADAHLIPAGPVRQELEQ